MAAINATTKDFPSLLDAVKGTCPALERKVVEGVLAESPVFSKLPQRVINGISYRYKVRKSLPLIGSRPANAGIEPFKSDYELKNGECYIYNGMFQVDKAVAMAYPDDYGTMMNEEARAGVRGLLFNLERTLFYGKAISEHGMHGLPDTIGDFMTFSMDSAHNTDDQRQYGGASVWALSLNPDLLRVIWGQQKVLSFGPMKEETVSASTATGGTGTLTTLKREILAWIGFSQQHEGAVGHIVNESASKPLTDDALAQLVNLFPSGIAPDILVMNRATRARLQANRASSYKYVKGTSGKTPYADIPTEYEGIPIVTTDALLADETAQNIAALAGQTKLTPIHNTGVLTR